MAVAGVRSNAALRANQTRRVSSAVRRLRTLAPFAKDDIREQVADYLALFGGTVGDLAGPDLGSARVFAARGLRVITAEDGRWLLRKADMDRELLEAALLRQANDIGAELHFGEFADILPRCTTAFYDPCGPYLETTGQLVRKIADSRLRAFVLTCELSRIDGGKGRPKAHYLRWARIGLAEDAPQYKIVHEYPYAGAGGVPMVVFYLHRDTFGERLAEVMDRSVAPMTRSEIDWVDEDRSKKPQRWRPPAGRQYTELEWGRTILVGRRMDARLSGAGRPEGAVMGALLSDIADDKELDSAEVRRSVNKFLSALSR